MHTISVPIGPMHSRALSTTGYLRLPQIIGKKPNPDKGVQGLPALVPVSASTLWQWVRDGKFPKPVKLSERVTAWRVEDVRAYLERIAA